MEAGELPNRGDGGIPDLIPTRERAALVVRGRCGARVTEVGRSLGRPPDTVIRWPGRGAAGRFAGSTSARQVDSVEEDLG